MYKSLFVYDEISFYVKKAYLDWQFTALYICIYVPCTPIKEGQRPNKADKKLALIEPRVGNVSKYIGIFCTKQSLVFEYGTFILFESC